MQRVLLSTTSFQDTPGDHHKELEALGCEVVRARGPLPEAKLLELIGIGGFDAFLCGDDEITDRVLAAAAPRLRAVCKYGIGVDSIDVAAATRRGIPVTFTPGVNHTTVTEHTICLLLALCRTLVPAANSVASGGWKRPVGIELHGKALGIVGFGRVGQEVARACAAAFAMRVSFYSPFLSPHEAAFVKSIGATRHETLEPLLEASDVVSLHCALTPDTRGLISAAALARMRPGAILLNTARGALVDEAAVAAACRAGALRGYGADVLAVEPPEGGRHPFVGVENALVTPHVGSRTAESVGRQAAAAVANLRAALRGDWAACSVVDAAAVPAAAAPKG